MFREAKPITGGREHRASRTASSRTARSRSQQNNFQARYAIRHRWTGPIACENPRRGVWGGPPGRRRPADRSPRRKLAFAPRGKLALPSVIARDLPEIGVRRFRPQPKPPAQQGGGGFATPPTIHFMGLGLGMLGALALVGAGALVTRRRG